jgi:hypothetical protein
MATVKMDLPQKLLGVFLLFAVAVVGIGFAADRLGAALNPTAYAAQQAQNDAEAKAAKDAKDASDAEQARTQAAKDFSDQEESFIFKKSTETRDTVLAQFDDPDSVTFRDVWAVRYGESFVYCGEAAARRADGSYTGYQPFMALGKESFLPANSPNFTTDYEPCITGARIVAVPF